ncbi:MAG: FAD-dependent oxidoreductase [Spirochaetota bacterium]
MFRNLFTAKRIGNVEIPNRFTVPAMVVNICREDGYPTEDYIAYHEAKARGGWGLIITQDYAVTPRGKGYAFIPGLWEDGQIEPHSELPRRVHRHGSKVFAQIYHAGRQSNDQIMGMTPVAPSAIPCPAKKQMPQVLSIPDIKEIVGQFGDTALRAKLAGFDGIEVHGAHGYLIAQFMSAYSNKRTDEYGGTFYNRSRFAREILIDIRRKVGRNFPVIFRISGDEFVPGGRTIEETKAMCSLLEEYGVDAFHISAGVYGSRHRVVPPARMEHAHIADHALEVKSVVSCPVITVGWINDPFTAEALIASGKADFVAMGRASLADPELPNKTASGDFDDIIYCIGCMQGCTAKIRTAGERGGCMLNPLTGRETELVLEPAKNKRRVFVAGGGIAGMEAAIVAAKRGHTVELFEKADHLGGQYQLASVPPGKGNVSGFIFWQTRQLEKLGVIVHLQKELTKSIVDQEKPDAVIAASGSREKQLDIPGSKKAHVVSATDVLTGHKDTGARVVVIGGGMIGAETANHLAQHEKQVTIVEIEDSIACEEEANTRYLLLKDLDESGTAIFTNTEVEEILDTGVRIAEKEGEQTLPADTVVIAVGITPDNSIAKALQGSSCKVLEIGDAKEVRKALEAIEEGYKAGMEL